MPSATSDAAEAYELLQERLEMQETEAEHVQAALREYIDAASRRSDLDRTTSKTKTGVFTGAMVRQGAFQQSMIYDVFQSLHPVIFWFLVLG